MLHSCLLVLSPNFPALKYKTMWWGQTALIILYIPPPLNKSWRHNTAPSLIHCPGCTADAHTKIYPQKMINSLSEIQYFLYSLSCLTLSNKANSSLRAGLMGSFRNLANSSIPMRPPWQEPAMAAKLSSSFLTLSHFRLKDMIFLNITVNAHLMPP